MTNWEIVPGRLELDIQSSGRRTTRLSPGIPLFFSDSEKVRYRQAPIHPNHVARILWRELDRLPSSRTRRIGKTFDHPKMALRSLGNTSSSSLLLFDAFDMRKQLNLRGVHRQPDHLFEFKTQFFWNFDRAVIVRRSHGYNPIQAECALPIRHHGGGRLIGVSVAPKFRKKREAEINIFQGFPFYQTADSNRGSILLQFNQVQPEAETLITLNRPFQNVITSVSD